MQIRDSLTLDASGQKMTQDGYLVGIAKVARAGNVQQYLGRELGLTGDDAVKVFGVYRDPDVVFNEDSMLTLAGRPVTLNHPSEPVTSENWKDLSIGHVGGRVAREGEHLTASLAIMDKSAVSKVQSGEGFLSAGYVVDAVRSAGISPSGEAYQFKQSGHVRFNHVAVLDGHEPRAGNTKFGDSQIDGGTDRNNWGATPITYAIKKDDTMTLRTITVDGLSVETTDAGVQAITKLQADLAATRKDLKDAKADFAKKMSEKDKEDAEKDQKIDKLEKDKLTPDALHALVAELSSLTADAAKIAPKVNTKGLTADAIRAAVVSDRLGAEIIADRSIDYINARYDALVTDASLQTTDSFRSAIQGGVQPLTSDAGWNDFIPKGA